MLKAGYTWAEIEYYWRNPDEFYEDNEEKELTVEEKAKKEYWQKLKNI